MQLLTFPPEIQQNIFNQMSPQTLFLTSQCSPAAKEAIKNAIIWTKSMEVIVWFSGPNEQDKATRVNFGVIANKKKWNVFEMELMVEEKAVKYENLQFTNLNIDGLEVSGNANFDEKGKMTLFVDSFENKLNKIHLHICELFQTKFDLFTQFHSLEEYKLFFPHSIKKSVLPHVSNKDIGWQNVNDFFKYHTTHYMSTIVNPRIKSPKMTENQKFTGLLNLVLINAGDDFYHAMDNFEGEHIVMHKALLDPILIKSFVNHWMNGKHPNLISVITFNTHGNFIDTKPTLKDLKAKKWEEGKRPRHFRYTSGLQKYQRFKRELFDCQEGLDVIRKTDGAIATIKLTQQYFLFFVWP